MKRRWLFLLLLFLCIGSPIVAQDVLLNTPIAYRGYDGNIYVTDLIDTYALTEDANREQQDGSRVSYSDPRWSADGQTLGFFRNVSGPTTGSFTGGVMVVRSGETPRLLLSTDDGYAIDSAMLALSPDGSHVAFFGWNQAQTEQTGIFTVAVDSGEVTFIVPAYNTSIGEAGSADPAIHMALTPTGQSSYREQFALSWGENGLLFTPAYDLSTTRSFVDNLALITLDGEPVWTAGDAIHYVLANDAQHIAAQSLSPDEGWISIDAVTGERTPLNLPDDAMPVGWVGELLFYRTRTDEISVQGNFDREAGLEVYDYLWGFEATSAMLTIYVRLPNGDDVEVTRLQGYDIGLIQGIDDSHIIVEMVRSSVPAVLAINEGAAPDVVRPLVARRQSIVMSVAYKEYGVVVRPTPLPGDDAAYGGDTFTVVVGD